MEDIVVTGLGVNSSIGSSVDHFWKGLIQGKCGVSEIDLFDVSHHPNRMACQIKNIKTVPGTQSPLYEMGRATRIFAPAIEEAMENANLNEEDRSPYRIGLCIGTTMGEIEPLENKLRHGAVNVRSQGPHQIASSTANHFSFSGPVWTFTNACSAGNFAIAKCIDELLMGRADVMIAGGVDALSWVAFTGFSSLRAMSPDLCRPFDRDRKGLILGEGAGVLVLEKRSHAEKRHVRARATMLGYGLGCDAHHITQPDPTAKGAVQAMENALKMAAITPSDISHISSHGTGTLANDRMEARGIDKLFHATQGSIAVNSIKGNIGHTLGAASAIEAVMSVKTIETGQFPPTLNFTTPDPDCDKDCMFINKDVLDQKVHVIMSNSYAFGGINSSILMTGGDI